MAADTGNRWLCVGRAASLRNNYASSGGIHVSSSPLHSATSSHCLPPCFCLCLFYKWDPENIIESWPIHPKNDVVLYDCDVFRSSKKTNKRDTGDIGGPYANSSFDKAPLVNKYPPNAPAGTRNGSLYAFANNGAPRIPRATTNSRADSLEMASSSRNYSETPPRSNPYASAQGHANPYYRDDEGKRF